MLVFNRGEDSLVVTSLLVPRSIFRWQVWFVHRKGPDYFQELCQAHPKSQSMQRGTEACSE